MRAHRWMLALAVVGLSACDDPARPAADAPPPASASSTGSITLPPPGSTIVVLEDLGVLAGGSRSGATAINASRQITGSSETAVFLERSFLWTPPGPMVELGGLEPFFESNRANDVNDAGQVTGSASNFGFDAFRWTPPGPMEMLEGPGIDQWGFAINNDGVVAGVAEDPASKPFLWDGATAIAVGYLNDGDFGYGEAWDINDDGEVVGLSTWGEGGAADLECCRAFRWTEAEGMTDLGTLPGGAESEANAVNELGGIVGRSETAAGPAHAVLWASASSPIVDLGTLGGSSSWARDINDAVVIVGESETGAGQTHAFRRPPGGPLVDLGTLGGDDSRARGVSPEGHVVGSAQLADGDEHAVAWWHYPVDQAFFCGCVAPKKPVNVNAPLPLEVVILTTPLLDAATVDPALLTLGDGEGDDTPVAEISLDDTDGDEDLDLVASFDVDALVVNGDLAPGTNSLLLLGVLQDRSNVVYGAVEVRVVPAGGKR